MTDKAVIFASKLGRTRKTAKYIAKELGADIFDLKKQTVIDLSEYKYLILGTGIRAGKPFGSLVDFLEKNQSQLKEKRMSLFLCCKFDEEKGKVQCEKVSEVLGITDATFFSSGEKNEEGISTAVDDYIKLISRR